MNEQMTPEERAQELKRLVGELQAEGRKDLLLHAIGVPLLEELRIEAAKGKLSRLVITDDYRFVLVDYDREVELQPVHKAVYLLFLAHPEGIEFKRLGISIDTASWQVRVKGELVSLTRKEFDTLRYLMEHRGTAVTRDQLMNEVWGYDYIGDSNIVDVYIRYLRHKIDDQYGIKTIHTIRSVGYLFEYEEEQE